jgi:anti-anti-sigma factor
MTARSDQESAVTWPDGAARYYRSGPHAVVELAGAIDADVEQQVAGVLNAALDSVRGSDGKGCVVVDLARAQFADSAALHLLLRTRAAAELRIAGPLAAQVRLLFDVTDLADSFAIYDDLKKALDA